MAQPRRTRRHDGRVSPDDVGAVARRAGLAVVVATLPLAVGTFAGLVAGAPSTVAGLELALTAMGNRLVVETGLASLFQLAMLGLLAGCWSVGLGLVLDGLLD